MFDREENKNRIDLVMHLFHLCIIINEFVIKKSLVVFSYLVKIRHENRMRLLSKFSVNDVLVLTL